MRPRIYRRRSGQWVLKIPSRMSRPLSPLYINCAGWSDALDRLGRHYACGLVRSRK